MGDMARGNMFRYTTDDEVEAWPLGPVKGTPVRVIPLQGARERSVILVTKSGLYIWSLVTGRCLAMVATEAIDCIGAMMVNERIFLWHLEPSLLNYSLLTRKGVKRIHQFPYDHEEFCSNTLSLLKFEEDCVLFQDNSGEIMKVDLTKKI